MSYTYAQPPLLLDVPPVTEPAKRHGVVYTKRWVVELILDMAGYRATEDLGALVAVEPACGEGSFVASMVERLVESCRRYGRDIASCGSALVAFELDPESASVSRAAAIRTLVGCGIAQNEASSLARMWIRDGDYLLIAQELPPVDVVVGNPPYIRLEDLDVAVAETYRRRYRTMVGRADVYVAFYEAALRGLKPGGVCTFVCADRWMLNQYGAELRRLVTSSFAVEAVIEMHRADAFESDVSAYPAITVIRRGDQGTAVVARAGAGVERSGAAALAQVLKETAAEGMVRRLPGLTATRVEGWFARDAPWPCSSPERLALLKHLEASFLPLESAGTGTKVGIGVATGADEVFITNDGALVEESRLLPLAMAADTRRGELEWSGNYLVNPWNEHGLVDLARYPRLAAYLEGHEEQLRGRHVGKRNVEGWFRTIDRVDHRLTARPKLYVADIKDRLNPVLDRGETYPHHNLYWVASVGWDIEVLGGLLLSDVAQFFVECYGVRMRGGYLRFQAQYLRRIRVPRPHDLTVAQTQGLRDAFRGRDRRLAAEVGLQCYGIDRLPAEVE
jgi:adenine-specific DNA-methyltransferase